MRYWHLKVGHHAPGSASYPRALGSHLASKWMSEPQSQLHTEGFQSLKEGEAVELTFQKSPKGLESLQLPVLVGVLCGE